MRALTFSRFGDPSVLEVRDVAGDLWNVLRTAEGRRSRAERLFAELRAGRLTVAIGERFPLARGTDAHRALEDRDRIGKLLLLLVP